MIMPLKTRWFLFKQRLFIKRVKSDIKRLEISRDGIKSQLNLIPSTEVQAIEDINKVLSWTNDVIKSLNNILEISRSRDDLLRYCYKKLL